jgi:hypothetical protein
MIDFERLRREVGKKNEDIAKIVSNVMYKNVTDEEWQIILEAKGTMFANILQKIQDEQYNYYVSKLITELQAATKCNREVDASIYGGLLEGIYESSYRTIYEEGCKRQKIRQEKDSRDQKKL